MHRKILREHIRIKEVITMESYKQEFIEFMVESNVLKFGDFTLKSGRKSPFLYECRCLCNRYPVKEVR
mgnify:CR=1 FL=1